MAFFTRSKVSQASRIVNQRENRQVKPIKEIEYAIVIFQFNVCFV
jgi:hypothetical protein